VIFCYWHGTERDLIREAVDAWRDYFVGFRVIGDSDVEPMIARRFPRYLEVYRKIRLPACKSDIARLVALDEWGGLYVDCHCGIADPQYVGQLLGNLDTFELIVVDEDPKYRQNPKPDRLNPMNGIMFARKNSEIIVEWEKSAFRNLANHWTVEKERGFSPYSVWSLTGAANLKHIIMDGDLRALKADFAQRVKIIPENLSPIVRNVHCSYRQPGMHWHERETRELLFD
jgi:mannosyltransferase OCH1-like enzyme